jgi:single-strand DNA-binding protein
MSINKVILVGRLGQDPELRYTQTGQAVCNFSVATPEHWTDKNGQKNERVEWHKVVVWGKLSELCSQYLSKGRQAYIEGKLQTSQWEDEKGNKRYTTEILAQNVQFLGDASQQNRQQNQNYNGNAQQNPAQGGYNPQAQQGGVPEGGFAADDIPF